MNAITQDKSLENMTGLYEKLQEEYVTRRAILEKIVDTPHIMDIPDELPHLGMIKQREEAEIENLANNYVSALVHRLHDLERSMPEYVAEKYESNIDVEVPSHDKLDTPYKGWYEISDKHVQLPTTQGVHSLAEMINEKMTSWDRYWDGSTLFSCGRTGCNKVGCFDHSNPVVIPFFWPVVAVWAVNKGLTKAAKLASNGAINLTEHAGIDLKEKEHEYLLARLDKFEHEFYMKMQGLVDASKEGYLADADRTEEYLMSTGASVEELIGRYAMAYKNFGEIVGIMQPWIEMPR